MKFTSKQIAGHFQRNEDISEFLNGLGKEIHEKRSQAFGSTCDPTIMNGRIDKWELYNGEISVTYYDYGRYGYQNWSTEIFPISWVNDDDWKVDLENIRIGRERAISEARLKAEDEAKRIKEAKEKSEYERLKKKYG